MANTILGNTRDYTKSDTSNDVINWVMVTVAGSLIMDQQHGKTNTLANVPAGIWIPVGNTIRIKAASTATGIMVI